MGIFGYTTTVARDQPGTCDKWDFKQKKTDNRKLRDKISKENAKNMQEEEDTAKKRHLSTGDETMGREVLDENENDLNFVGKAAKKKRANKIDVMGPITPTADRLGLSFRQRRMIAASVANSMNINIDETNIGKSAAHAHAKKKRVKIAKSIKGKFKKPRRGILHWDGKILKVKGNMSSNRMAFYITGATYNKEKKLLGCPETEGQGLQKLKL